MGPCDGEGPRRDQLLLGSAVLAVHVLNAAARHLARLPSQGPSAPAKTMNGQRASERLFLSPRVQIWLQEEDGCGRRSNGR